MNTKSGDTLDWFLGRSTIYYRLLWLDLEPEEGKYRLDSRRRVQGVRRAVDHTTTDSA